MSVITTIFDLLSQDDELKGMLAKHELAEDYPAIYDRWVIEDVPLPYISITWDFSVGDSPFKQNSRVILDIFTSGSSTLQAELIRDRLKELLQERVFQTIDGPVRTHYLRDADIPEEVPSVVHWSIEFQIIYWEKLLLDEPLPPREPLPVEPIADPPTPINLSVEWMYAGTYKLRWELDGRTPPTFQRFHIVVNDVYTIFVNDGEAREYLIHGIDESSYTYIYMATEVENNFYYSNAVEIYP